MNSKPEQLPFLEAICWQTKDVYQYTPEQMLSRYERGWKYRHLFNNLEGEELAFIKQLARSHSSWLESLMTFTFPHHNKIITVLESLNSELFEQNCAYFGGGTLISLDFGEYRLSKDIDFICPVSSSGYKNLRTLIFDAGYNALFRNSNQVRVTRGSADQYGIRMVVEVEGELIKTEIIAEARFELDRPRYPQWTTIACLSFDDCFTSKLLANADRFMDDSVDARDLIDLAMLRRQSPIPQKAIAKAEKAYEVMRPLQVAIKRFQDRETYRQQCFENLNIERSQIPQIIDGVDLLAGDLRG